MRLDLLPFQRVGRLAFGDTEEAVIRTLGAPTRRRQRAGVTRLVWQDGWIATIFREGGLDEVEVAPGGEADLVVAKVSVLTDPSALPRLCTVDRGVRVTDDGLLLFPSFGVVASGLQTRRIEDLSVTACSTGNWAKREAFPSRPFVNSGH